MVFGSWPKKHIRPWQGKNSDCIEGHRRCTTRKQTHHPHGCAGSTAEGLPKPVSSFWLNAPAVSSVQPNPNAHGVGVSSFPWARAGPLSSAEPGAGGSGEFWASARRLVAGCRGLSWWSQAPPASRHVSRSAVVAPFPRGPRRLPAAAPGRWAGSRARAARAVSQGQAHTPPQRRSKATAPGTWAFPEVDASVGHGCGVSLGPGVRRLLGRFSLGCRPHPKIKPSLMDVSMSLGRVYLKCWGGTVL